MDRFVKIIAIVSKTVRVRVAVAKAMKVEDTSFEYDYCGAKGGVYGG